MSLIIFFHTAKVSNEKVSLPVSVYSAVTAWAQALKRLLVQLVELRSAFRHWAPVWRFGRGRQRVDGGCFYSVCWIQRGRRRCPISSNVGWILYDRVWHERVWGDRQWQGTGSLRSRRCCNSFVARTSLIWKVWSRESCRSSVAIRNGYMKLFKWHTWFLVWQRWSRRRRCRAFTSDTLWS